MKRYTAKTLKKLKEVCERIPYENEYNCVAINGIKNLSRSDVDSIELYVDTILKNGSIDWMMSPRGSVLEVLESAGVELN